MEDLVIAAGVVIAGRDLSWTAARASGPGGQNVNKVSSKVDLRFDLPASALPEDLKTRLRARAGARLDSDGRIVVTSQRTREQHRNLEDALQKLAELVRAALVVPKKRRATKPSRASQQRRLDEKRQRSEVKRARREVP